MTDCIIIGAGYAGLRAASVLQASNQSVLVLEARERVGGRILTQNLGQGLYVDLGGQWIGPGQSHMYDLAAAYHVPIFSTHDIGKSTLYLNGKTKSYKGIIPPLPILSLLSLDAAIRKINQLAKKISLEKPWEHPHALVWDKLSLHDWMQVQMKQPIARKMFTVAAEAIFACDPKDLSFLHALFYVRSNGNFDYLMNTRKGAQQDRLKGGAQSICLKMAEALGDQILCNKKVTQVSQSQDSVCVEGPGFSYTAKRAIVALPPAVARDIVFSPSLPAERSALMAQQFMGQVVKCYAIYEQPFWRKKFLSGLAAAPDELVSVVFDNSPAGGDKGILMGFALGRKAKELMGFSQTDRKEMVLASFARIFGAAALQAEQYLDHSFMDEPESKGCYAGLFAPGHLAHLSADLSAPTGRIHWAGTETSAQFNGYMEGAVRSGERAAVEIRWANT